MIGIIALVAVLAIVVLMLTCLAVGILIDDSLGALGRNPRRAPRTSYWSIR